MQLLKIGDEWVSPRQVLAIYRHSHYGLTMVKLADGKHLTTTEEVDVAAHAVNRALNGTGEEAEYLPMSHGVTADAR